MISLMTTISDLLAQLDTLILTPLEIVLNLLITLLLSLWTLFVYKKSYQTTVYNKSFAMTIPISALVTTMVIMAVSSNVILSLGMVGALSIVRFRTAIKNPLDTIYMFWAIGIGITVGANSSVLAVIGSIVIGLAILFIQGLELFTTPYILIIKMTAEVQEDVLFEAIKKIYPKFQVRNKSITLESSEYTFELRGNRELSKQITPLKSIPGVQSVMLLSYRSDYVV
jgi:uncharacterized membrane protein YhiD involved in acid resistance